MTSSKRFGQTETLPIRGKNCFWGKAISYCELTLEIALFDSVSSVEISGNFLFFSAPPWWTLCFGFPRRHDPGNALKIGGHLNILPARQQLPDFCFLGKADLRHEPAAGAEALMRLGNQPAVDLHAFLAGEDGDFRLEFAHLFLHLVGLGFADVRRIRD